LKAASSSGKHAHSLIAHCCTNHCSNRTQLYKITCCSGAVMCKPADWHAPGYRGLPALGRPTSRQAGVPAVS
jgi:hypothetical protein